MDNEDFLFPPYKFVGGFHWGHRVEGKKVIRRGKKVDDKDEYYHLSVQRLDQILQRLDPTMSSCMFRYGHSEQLFYSGYSEYDLKDIGDWESTRMPEIYAKRRGITPPSDRFAKDLSA